MKEVLRSTGAHVTTETQELTEALTTGCNKLNNAACLATEYYFRGQEPAVLVTGSLIFGSKLVQKKTINKHKSLSKGKLAAAGGLANLISAPKDFVHVRTGNTAHHGPELDGASTGPIFSHFDGKRTWTPFDAMSCKLIGHAMKKGCPGIRLPYAFVAPPPFPPAAPLVFRF
jgi:hypothetical protein